MKAWMALLWAGIGFGIGYFVGDRVRQKMDDDGVNEQAAKEVTPEQLGYSVPDTDEEKTDDDFDEEEDFDTGIEEMESFLAETEHPEDDAPEFEPKKHEDKTIMIVPMDEMLEDLENYPQVCLHWYAVDDVLCDDTDAQLPLEERDQILGSIMLDDVADEYFYGDGKELAVRNDILETYYDIYCLRYAYSDINGEREEEE